MTTGTGRMNIKISLQVMLLCGLLGACSQLPAPPPSAPAPVPNQPAATAPAPAAVAKPAGPSVKPPAAAAAVPAPLLHIDPAQSLIAVTVRRGGMLARLGHDHLVAARTVSGTVAPAQNRADFQFRLDQLTVDEAPLRTAAGLEKQPSADAIEGTRSNMLTKVLDAGRYPLVAVHAERGAPGQPLQTTITLHGVSRTLAIPVDIRANAGIMTVTGTVNLKQSDFGIVPFSLMGGALAVQDQLELKFTLVAR
jgi:polyisoprenoid-binding protein YceI